MGFTTLCTKYCINKIKNVSFLRSTQLDKRVKALCGVRSTVSNLFLSFSLTMLPIQPFVLSRLSFVFFPLLLSVRLSA